jgi:hypothetical protein
MIIHHFYGAKWVARNKTSVNNIVLMGNENLPYNGLATVSLQFWIWVICSVSKRMSLTFFQTVNHESPVYQLTLLKLIRDKIISSLIPYLFLCHVMQCVQWSNPAELQTLVYSYMAARPGPASVGLPGYCTVQTVWGGGTCSAHAEWLHDGCPQDTNM